MKHTVALILFALCVCASPGFAQTCVGAAFDKPFPRAVAVETRHVDVPSPRFPGVWQEGFIHGYFYQIFANGEAVLAEGKSDADWEISISCGDENCLQDISGRPPEGVDNITELLVLCLKKSNLSDDVVEQKLAVSKEATNNDGQIHALTQPLMSSETGGNPEVVRHEAYDNDGVIALAEATDEAVAIPCGLAAIPEGTQGQTLQRLLVLAGAKPGPIDGIVGKSTRRAITDVLGTPQSIVDVPNTISELHSFLCQ